MLEFEALISRVSEAIKLNSEREIAKLTKEFNSSVQTLVKTAFVNSNCADIMFINLTPLSVVANGSAFVDNYELQPGGFLGIMGNNAEINKTTYNVVFQSAVTKVIVIKKLYTQP